MHMCFAALQGQLATWPPQSVRSRGPQTGHSSDLQVGDWGRNGDMNQSEVADLMTKVASGFQPNFIISSGDNFYESEQETETLGHQGVRGAWQLGRSAYLQNLLTCWAAHQQYKQLQLPFGLWAA